MIQPPRSIPDEPGCLVQRGRELSFNTHIYTCILWQCGYASVTTWARYLPPTLAELRIHFIDHPEAWCDLIVL